MPSIEELLNEAELHMAAQPVNDVLEINPETREISIPDSEIILGVETDKKAERKYFHCPKIVGNNIDLSALELYVVFQNASNKEEGKDRYHVTDVKTTSDGYITFSWELSAKVTAYKGDVQFVVCAIKTDSSGVKKNVWNTTIAIGKCLIGLSSDMSASEEQSASDLYTQLVSELNSTASAKMTEVTTQIQTVGKNQVANVNNAGTTQVNNVQDKGAEVLASIPSTYTELDASVKQLNEQIRGKAPVIVENITSQSGKPVSVSDSAEMQLQGLYYSYNPFYDASLPDKGLANWKAHLASNPLVVMTYLDTPIETDLTEAQIQAYKSLTTFKPTSIISNDENAQMNVEYACDTKTWVTNKINTLDDLIQTRRDFAKKTGYSLTRFTMNTETWEYVLKAEDTKKQVLGITAYQGGIRLQQSQVTEYLRGYGIEIEVYDKLYIDPTDNKTKYFVPTGIVSCQSGGIYLGDYVFGKTPEERSGSLTDGNLSIVETGISVYTYATNHPINTHCVVSMIGLPTFEGMDSVVVMKVA